MKTTLKIVRARFEMLDEKIAKMPEEEFDMYASDSSHLDETLRELEHELKLRKEFVCKAKTFFASIDDGKSTDYYEGQLALIVELLGE